MCIAKWAKLVNRDIEMLKSKYNGFTLIEVMISLVVATIAILGLAAAQLKSLQYITNSFNYSASLVQANNVIERIWPRLCELQHTNPGLYYEDSFQEYLAPQINAFSLTLPTDFSNDLEVAVTWQDKRLTDNLENRVVLNSSFPMLPADCTP